MSQQVLQRQPALGSVPGRSEPQSSPRRFASTIITRWRNGEPADAAAFFADHPHLTANKTLVLDLVYEEYCQRVSGGEDVDVEEFCEAFPDIADSLRKLFSAHQFLAENPQLYADQAPLIWPEVGDNFLGFCLEEELGNGTFARVFRATEPALGGRHVAVKIAFHGAAEAELLGKLSHPSIVPIHSVRKEETTGMTAVCMPYLGRATLADVIKQGFSSESRPRLGRLFLDVSAQLAGDGVPVDGSTPDPLLKSGSYCEGVLKVGQQLAAALAYTHAQGIYHCDLKPSNILIGTDGRPRLLDFNLSFQHRLAMRVLGGTVPYMAPEQLQAMDQVRKDQPPAVDHRSDLYSLGVVLYELLTGTVPYVPDTKAKHHKELRQTLLAEQRRGPRPLREHNPDVERWLDELVCRCLAFDVRTRPQSATELARELGNGLTGWRSAVRWLHKHARAVTAASVVGVAVLGGVMTYVAVRPSYVERQLASAWDAYRNHDYHLAEQRFQDVMAVDLKCGDAYFGRARARVKLGQYLAAHEDFAVAHGLSHDPKHLAAIGFCLAKAHGPAYGLTYSRDAFDDGFQTAEVHNNLGYSYLRSGKLALARQHLDKAVAINPDSLVVRHNRLTMHFLAARGLAAPDGSWSEDVRRALELGSDHADIHADVARLLATLATRLPDLEDGAIDELKKAIAHGYGFVNLEKDPTWVALRRNPAFAEVARTNPSSTEQRKFEPVLDPIQD